MDLYQPHGGVHLASLKQSCQIPPQKYKQKFREWIKHLSPKQRIFLALEKKQYTSPETFKFIALSKMVQKDMMSHYHLPEKKTALIYNGVNTQLFSYEKRNYYQKQKKSQLVEWTPKIFTLLFMAHNFSLKGLSCALECVGLLKNKFSHIRLLVAGRGNKNHYLNQIKKYGIEKEVLFLGAVQKPEYLYAVSQVLLHPTFYDPCSLVSMEALASGLPVVTTRYNGVSELLQSGGGMVLSNPHKASEFAKKIEVLQEPSIWKKNSEEAYNIGKKYTIQKNTNLMIQLFQKVASLK